jgi:hypothetical protein
MEARFLVEVLSEEPQRHIKNSRSARILIRPVAAERLLLIPLPHRCSRSVGNKPRRVEMIDMNEMEPRLCRGGERN